MSVSERARSVPKVNYSAGRSRFHTSLLSSCVPSLPFCYSSARTVLCGASASYLSSQSSSNRTRATCGLSTSRSSTRRTQSTDAAFSPNRSFSFCGLNSSLRRRTKSCSMFSAFSRTSSTCLTYSRPLLRTSKRQKLLTRCAFSLEFPVKSHALKLIIANFIAKL